ncbi:glycosyltransferase family 2 protein [Olivibacter sitiensis]|uniref:glycosyltransferase family 2 protein n=1 Tax=Olivibacter sitiensis TaxID=376470 RepID=UPI00042546FB|nr:glycosyltransferase family 2 protein [Olivibacter sitiensis]
MGERVVWWTAAIVLYENNEREVQNTIASCLASAFLKRLYLVDNSKTDRLRFLATDGRIEYLHNEKNRGFGGGHNIAIEESSRLGVAYHLILNPDVYFSEEVIPALVTFMESNHRVGMVMPKVVYPDGRIQRLCKLLPTPVDLFLRRFLPVEKGLLERQKQYELWAYDYDRVMDIPNLSGCFMFMRSEVFEKVGQFDDRYFMYMEDLDLVRRIGTQYDTVCYPFVSVFHIYKRGSYVDLRLLLLHLASAVRYFNKWGWLFDGKRKQKNGEVLQRLGKLKDM